MIDPSLTQTVRLYCDGELPREAAREFERKLEGDLQLQRAVQFERSLRVRVSAVLSSESKAPVNLAQRLREALDREIDPLPIPITAAPANGASGKSRDVEHTPILQPTWRINYLAVAAVLLLVIGAVMFGVLFPQIDTLQPGSTLEQAELFSAIGSYVATEHERAGDPAIAEDKFDLSDPQDMQSKLSKHLGAPITPIDLSALGYELIGGATCGALPCGGPSAHMLFKKADGRAVSIFCVPESRLDDYLATKEQREWVVNNETNTKCRKRVLRLDYPDTGLVYFLVTCDPDALEPASQLVLRQLHSASR